MDPRIQLAIEKYMEHENMIAQFKAFYQSFLGSLSTTTQDDSPMQNQSSTE